MTIQMRHCVRAAQRGDKIAAEELIKALSPIYTIKPRNTSGFIRISMRPCRRLIMGP
mgnify:CR=1 FL=1